jgi:phage terminase large subunit GpA-like protein
LTRILSLPSEATASLAREFFSVIKPAPRLTLSAWADTNRVLSREGSAEPGRWQTARAEYQRGIMDAVTDPRVDIVVCQKGTQVGWTEIVNNAVAYFVDQDPSPLLVVQPTVELAETWSKERLSPMIRDNPTISAKFKDARSRDSGNTLRHKEFIGGYVAIVGANAPAGLAARPIRVVVGDEVDRYPASAGTEGDPLKLAKKRQATFWNRKTLLGSAPLIKGLSVIEREYLRSDMRRFYVPCPECKEFQSLRWEQVKFDAGETIEARANSAHYCCENCGALWIDAERWDAVALGEWRATRPFTGTAGFHLSQFYSPWVKLAEIVKEFLEAKGNPTLMQVWVNTVLGETWEEQGETVKADGLRERVENYGPDDLPNGVHYATAGVDVQGDRLECEVVGWGAGDESWGIRYEILYGDPAQQDVWAKLDALLLEKFWTEDGRLVRVRSAAIDTGGHHGAQSIAFARKRVARKIYPIKGASGARPVWPKRASKTKNTRDNIWLVGVDTAKDSIYGRFKIIVPGPGFCHLPDDYDDDWFEQATSETVVTRYREGRPYRVWVLPGGKRNEALDCRVYAFAARMSLEATQTNPSTVRVDKTAIPASPASTTAAISPAQILDTAKPRGRRMRSRGI